jgi:uncharacterized membrane protein
MSNTPQALAPGNNSRFAHFTTIYLQAALYVVAGLVHFVLPQFYMVIFPEWMPFWPLFWIYLSGALEIVLGLSLLSPTTRRLASYLLIAMLLVFLGSVHIPMVFDYWDKGMLWRWGTIARVPAQFGLIWWAWRASTWWN